MVSPDYELIGEIWDYLVKAHNGNKYAAWEEFCTPHDELNGNSPGYVCYILGRPEDVKELLGV